MKNVLIWLILFCFVTACHRQSTFRQEASARQEILLSEFSEREDAAYEMTPRLMLKGIQSKGENSETYSSFVENKFQDPVKNPLSTFAVDVDAASYSNVRRFLQSGSLPPQDAVRIEEMINYFTYDVVAPKDGRPVAIFTELGHAPWNNKHQLMRVSLKAKDIPKESLPASNFVFLIDVSGSMHDLNKLPLVKTSLKILMDQMRDIDRVAIVTYAGSAEVKLESTSAKYKTKIKDMISQLEANGATAGGDGLRMAYAIAKDNYIKGGNNRIVMATDGDFNVGDSSDEEMEGLISKERDAGINISVLGYGMGNLKDRKLELIANKGRGNYVYINNISEARKAIIAEFGGTLFTVAKDVKLQVEFNPHYVRAYRLVGYENRLLEAEDFNNDKKVGGDMGVGHTVTALYEIVPVEVDSEFVGKVDPLKYQKEERRSSTMIQKELATVKFRYKDVDEDTSKLQEHAVLIGKHDKPSVDLLFMSSVVELGLLLRNSDYKQGADFDQLIKRAKSSIGKDVEGYRVEFIRLAQDAKSIHKANTYAKR